MQISEWIEKLSAIEKKATPGPWSLHRDDDGDTERVHALGHWTGCDEGDDSYNQVGIIKLPVEKYGYGCAWASETNGSFIAESRNALPVLLEMVKILSEECALIATVDGRKSVALSRCEKLLSEEK